MLLHVLVTRFALTCALLAAATAHADGKTLWLVQPLYPGQEALVGRVETALDKLTPKDARPSEVIGHKELQSALKNKTADLSCLFGEKTCGDPIDAFVGALGFERVVMIRGGQDEAGYQFQVTSYRPASGEISPAEA